MTQWEYVKGSDQNFKGAPEWATIVIGGEHLRGKYWAEQKPVGKLQSFSNVFMDPLSAINTLGGIIAERRKVDNLQSHVTLPKELWTLSHDDGNDPRLALTYSRGRYGMVADPDGEWVKVSKYDYQKLHKMDNLQSRVNDANLGDALKEIFREDAIAEKYDKYNRPCKGVTIDVYDVLVAFNVTNPALQHLIKKALAVGQRGHKDKNEDLNDILASAKRAIELEERYK